MAISWLEAVITILIGSLAGGMTNRIAVWMLFRPIDPPRIFGRPARWLQGVIPKNRAKLARSVGEVVGGSLLTPADITTHLKGLEAELTSGIRSLVVGLASGPQRALADWLPEEAAKEVHAVLVQLLESAAGALADRLEDTESGFDPSALLEHLRDGTGSTPIAVADPESFQAAREFFDQWLEGIVLSQPFADEVRAALNAAARRTLRHDTTLEDLLPAALLGTAEGLIESSLPVVVESVAAMLERPQAQSGVNDFVREQITNVVDDMRFHQRMVARMVLRGKTVSRAVKKFQGEGTDYLRQAMENERARSTVTQTFADGLQGLTTRPLASLVGTVDDPKVQGVLDDIADRLVEVLRSAQTRRVVVDRAAEKLGGQSWAEIGRLIPAAETGSALAIALRSDVGTAIVHSLAENAASRILSTPMGQFGRFWDHDSAVRVADAITPRIWDWMSHRVPDVVARIQISENVARKVEELPMNRIEELIHNLSRRELNMIVRLGYTLGAFIGALLVVSQLLLR